MAKLGPVFISYKRDDFYTANLVRQALRGEGFNIWWDDNLQTGQKWEEEIDRALFSAAIIVVLWSEKSVLSDWVCHEASIGKIRNNLTHAKIDSVDISKIPEPFRAIQLADLSQWNGSENDLEFRNIVASISSTIKKHKKTISYSKCLTNCSISMVLSIVFSIWFSSVHAFKASDLQKKDPIAMNKTANLAEPSPRGDAALVRERELRVKCAEEQAVAEMAKTTEVIPLHYANVGPTTVTDRGKEINIPGVYETLRLLLENTDKNHDPNSIPCGFLKPNISFNLRTNSLIVQAPPDIVADVKKLVTALDKPIK